MSRSRKVKRTNTKNQKENKVINENKLRRRLVSSSPCSIGY